MIPASLLLPLVIGALATAGFAANEWTHGGVSEELGMGHHHMLDHPLHACHGSEGNGSAPGPMHEGMRCAPAEG